jgi:hypothetical protein
MIDQLFGTGFHGGIEKYASGLSIHNNYLEILYDFGAIGFFSLFYIIFSFYSKTDAMHRALLVVILVISMSLSPLGASTYWGILGFIFANTFSKFRVKNAKGRTLYLQS